MVNTPYRVFGILNVTPDSFSDGGLYMEPNAAVARGLELEREGAAYIDVGGESTRPGAEAVGTTEELRRVIPVLEGLRAAGLEAAISIDTSKVAVARAAVAAGASFVNDVTKGDLWLFPGGIPHSIQGLGPDGAMFLLVFNDGSFNEFETFLLTDWFKHTPKEVLAKNFSVPASTFDKVPKKELFIFQAGLPGPLSAEQTQAAQGTGTVPHSVDFKASTMKPTFVETNPSRRPSAKQTRTCTLDRLGCINQAHCIAR